MVAAVKREQAQIDHRDPLVLGILTPWSVAAAFPGRQQAALLCATPSNPAQGLGPCLPWLGSRVAAGRTKGARGNDAPPLSSGPAGVPGGSGSRGAAPFYADPANGGSQEGDLAMIAGCRLSRGASVEGRA